MNWKKCIARDISLRCLATAIFIVISVHIDAQDMFMLNGFVLAEEFVSVRSCTDYDVLISAVQYDDTYLN